MRGQVAQFFGDEVEDFALFEVDLEVPCVRPSIHVIPFVLELIIGMFVRKANEGHVICMLHRSNMLSLEQGCSAS